MTPERRALIVAAASPQQLVDIETRPEDGKEYAVNVTAVGGGELPMNPLMQRIADGTAGQPQQQASM